MECKLQKGDSITSKATFVDGDISVPVDETSAKSENEQKHAFHELSFWLLFRWHLLKYHHSECAS